MASGRCVRTMWQAAEVGRAVEDADIAYLEVRGRVPPEQQWSVGSVSPHP
ncbi:hypothetical protein [Kitasatospora sp. NPDC097691]